MKNKIKASIVGTLLAATLGAGSYATGGGVVRLDVGSKTEWMSNNQYEELKIQLLDKYPTGQNIHINDYQLFIAVLNKEWKDSGLKNLKDVNEQNIVPKMIEEIKK